MLLGHGVSFRIPRTAAGFGIGIPTGPPGVRIERIVSLGHASPEGFWYDQEASEWVLLLKGAARLRFERQEPIELQPGSFVNIPAHKRPRVKWTDPGEVTIWLAVHYGDRV